MDESIMERLQDISGYMGGTISNYTGECLVCDAARISGNLEETSATFNDIFRKSHAARVSEDLEETSTTFNDIFRKANRVSNELKLGKTEIMEIHTEKSVILMGCSGEDERVHLHLFALFAKDGSVALGKLAIKKILPQAVEMLS